MPQLRENLTDQVGLAQLVEAFRGQDADKLADFFRDVIVEEIREGCIRITGLQVTRDPLLKSTKMSLDFLGTGNHAEDLLPTDEQRVRNFILGSE